jgi:uncharacterized protein YfaQ (DUF2300 family)
VNTSGPLHSIKQMRVSMKRLMIVTALLLATVSTSVWAQAPATATDAPRNPPQAAAPVPMQPAQSGAMPMTNCAGNTKVRWPGTKQTIVRWFRET